MADESKIGRPWDSDELDAIVVDYFSMLSADLSGRPYVKARHSAVLMAQIGRTHRSVEFKHQNISAVLDELGMSWIPGYKPKRNYQNAIFDAIDRYLTKHPDALEPALARRPEPPSPGEIFVAAPNLLAAKEEVPERLERLVRKFDPVERDHRNRSLGKAGEEFVVNIERRNLTQADRHDLARKVRWVADEEGDGAGYDVLSFDPGGRERLLEVKTTNVCPRCPYCPDGFACSRFSSSLWPFWHRPNRSIASFIPRCIGALLGPRAGCARALAGVPSQPNVFYIGFDNGGLWRSTDFGSTWVPLFDSQPTGSIGAIAVSPSDPNVIYVGTGAGIIRPDLAVGDGVYTAPRPPPAPRGGVLPTFSQKDGEGPNSPFWILGTPLFNRLTGSGPIRVND